MILIWSIVIIEIRVELGMEVDLMVVSVVVKVIIIILLIERVNLCVCYYKKFVFMFGKILI